MQIVKIFYQVNSNNPFQVEDLFSILSKNSHKSMKLKCNPLTLNYLYYQFHLFTYKSKSLLSFMTLIIFMINLLTNLKNNKYQMLLI